MELGLLLLRYFKNKILSSFFYLEYEGAGLSTISFTTKENYTTCQTVEKQLQIGNEHTFEKIMEGQKVYEFLVKQLQKVRTQPLILTHSSE